MKIKGQNLRFSVKIDGVKTYFAASTNAQLHVAADLEDSSTKDSTDDWQEQEVTGLSWDAQTESLVTLEDNGTNGELPQDLLSLMINKTKVHLVFDQTAGTNNRVAQNSVIKMSGWAWVNDLSIQAANRQNSTISAQFSGTGPLVKA